MLTIPVKDYLFGLGLVRSWPRGLPGDVRVPTLRDAAVHGAALLRRNALLGAAAAAYAFCTYYAYDQCKHGYLLRGTSHRRHRYDLPPPHKERLVRAYVLSLFVLPLHLGFSAKWLFSIAYPLLLIYYFFSFTDGAEKDGRRAWPLLRARFFWGWLASRVESRVFVADEDALRENDKIILACHPHGVMPYGAFLGLATDAVTRRAAHDGELDRAKAWYFAAASAYFYVPVVREVLLWLGFVDASFPYLEEIAGREQRDAGVAVATFPGGGSEALVADALRIRSPIVRVLDRFGFLYLALRQGLAVVPVYTFGEIQAHRLAGGEASMDFGATWLDRARLLIAECLGLYVPYLANVAPRRHQTVTVVGEPIEIKERLLEPTREQVLQLQERYCKALRALHARYANPAEPPFNEGTLRLK
mmetsp:Transcript_18841/g.57258  ORF Transcript_18841/g.57258 Transcript_18841/m.57258 type:complete len:417 (-) Transcript_18841:32-1282(-)